MAILSIYAIFAPKRYKIPKKMKEAILSSKNEMTSFRCGDCNVRFRTPSSLNRYLEIKEWDNGYLVVIADYKGLGETEEYIDLVPILKNLYIDPKEFLGNIQTVRIGEYEC